MLFSCLELQMQQPGIAFACSATEICVLIVLWAAAEALGKSKLCLCSIWQKWWVGLENWEQLTIVQSLITQKNIHMNALALVFS